jgi:AraC-like DNA-binding protein
MLREGMPLADLAVQLGFSDQSHFQRTFRERASVTPGDYQRKLRC